MEIYDINTIYSQYKDFVNSNYSELKDEVELMIRRKRLSSVMNDTKWLKDHEDSPPPFFNIEWMSIQPLYEIYRGRLVNPEIIDKSDVLLGILHKYHIPFEKEDEHTFVIYGYK